MSDSLSWEVYDRVRLRETGNAPLEQRHWLCAFFYSVRLPRASANRYTVSNAALSHGYIFHVQNMIFASWEIFAIARIHRRSSQIQR